MCVCVCLYCNHLKLGGHAKNLTVEGGWEHEWGILLWRGKGEGQNRRKGREGRKNTKDIWIGIWILIFELIFEYWNLQLALDGESPIPASFSKPNSLRDSPTKKRCQKAQFHTVGDYGNSSAVATSSPSLCLTFQIFATQSQLVADTLSPLARLHNLPALVRAAASPATISGTAGLR